MSERIHSDVDGLKRKFGTTDPFVLIDALGIDFGYSEAIKLKGYYVVQNRKRFIRVASNLNAQEQAIVAAHELGHDRYHREYARIHPLRDFALYDMTSKSEHQANLFAAELLVADDEVLACISEESDYPSMCAALSVHPSLMAFKLHSMLQRGYKVNMPHNIDSRFLKKY